MVDILVPIPGIEPVNPLNRRCWSSETTKKYVANEEESEGAFRVERNGCMLSFTVPILQSTICVAIVNDIMSERKESEGGKTGCHCTPLLIG